MEWIIILLLQILNYGFLLASNSTNLQTLVRTKMIRITKRSLSTGEDSYVFDKNEVRTNPRIPNSHNNIQQNLSLYENQLRNAKAKIDGNGSIGREKQFEEWVGKRDSSANQKLNKIGYQKSLEYKTEKHEKDSLNSKMGLSIFVKQLMKNNMISTDWFLYRLLFRMIVRFQALN